MYCNQDYRQSWLRCDQCGKETDRTWKALPGLNTTAYVGGIGNPPLPEGWVDYDAAAAGRNISPYGQGVYQFHSQTCLDKWIAEHPVYSGPPIAFG